MASFIISLSVWLVLYTKRSDTLFKVNFIANEALLANFGLEMWPEVGHSVHFGPSAHILTQST